MKTFLSDIRTKDELTEYLAQKIVNKYSGAHQDIIVTFQDKVVTNSENLSFSHLASSQKEANTKILLHAVDAADRGLKTIDIQSPDTDVLVLTIRRYPKLCSDTNFITGTGNLSRKISVKQIYENIGEAMAEALPGFHAFAGSDQTGKFAGKAKISCCNTLQTATDDILQD